MIGLETSLFNKIRAYWPNQCFSRLSSGYCEGFSRTKSQFCEAPNKGQPGRILLLNPEFLSLMVVGGDLFPARSLSIGTTIDVSILLHWMHAKEARAGYNGGERGLGHIVLKFACLPLSKLS